MKRIKLKNTLKPIIKECINEILLEEGVLSNIVSEIAKGLSSSLIIENNNKTQTSPINIKQQKLLEHEKLELEHEKNKMIKEQRKKLLNATGLKTNIFENIAPLSSGGETKQNYGALSGQDPHDPGVDISGIMATSDQKRDKLL